MDLYQIEGLETVEATDGENRALFLMNHNAYPVVAPVPGKVRDMLSKEEVDSVAELEPYGVRILKL